VRSIEIHRLSEVSDFSLCLPVPVLIPMMPIALRWFEVDAVASEAEVALSMWLDATEVADCPPWEERVEE